MGYVFLKISSLATMENPEMRLTLFSVGISNIACFLREICDSSLEKTANSLMAVCDSLVCSK